jgi:hypothetical protein
MKVRRTITSNQPAGALPGGPLIKALIVANPFSELQSSQTMHGCRRNSLVTRPKWISSVSGGNLFGPVLSCSPVTLAQLLTSAI